MAEYRYRFEQVGAGDVIEIPEDAIAVTVKNQIAGTRTPMDTGFVSWLEPVDE